MIRIQSAPLDIESELQAFRPSSLDYGALASFEGYVRGEDGKVTALELQHYPAMTEAEIARFEQVTRDRFEVLDCLIIHRVGRILPSEAIVLVAVLAKHRKPAFEAVDFLMDYLKTSAPFWKKQIGPDGETWIEPRSSDHAAAAAWNKESYPE
ncbi:molybdenum cofactor biosynthesis protein MoaE [Hyphomonas sp.]|uniref:molybdenum cofactor biosynthesis protein MoaE n=1 Tax=Hyphomonas sp. TaxID=87 RepID=UPI0032D97F90